MVMTYDEYLKKNKKKKKEEPKVVLGYSSKNNVNNSTKSTTNTQTLIDKYIAEQQAKKDIAPVKTTVTTPKKQGERTWFQAGGFSDGYDFGDVTKTILGTTGDVGLGITKGVFNLAEGIVDLGRYGVSGVANKLGAKEYAKDVKKTAQENTTEKWFSPIEKKIDKYSVIGEKGDTIPEGLGYVGGMIATGGLGGAIGGAVGGTAKAVQIGATLGTTGTTFTSAFGSGMSQAYQDGASDEEAVSYGVISGIAEAGTELLFGGLGKTINAVGLNTGLSSADDMLAKKVSEVFKSQVAKNIAETGIKMGAEGTEEVIAGILQAVGQKVTYKSEEELMQLINDQELLESFISGAVVSGIAQTPSVIRDTKAGVDYVTGYTQQEQQAIDKVVNERITEQERQGITLTKKEKNAIIEQTTKEFDEFKKKSSEIAPVKDDVRSQDIAPVQQAGQQDAPVNERQQNYVSEAKETDSVYRKNLNEDASKYANNSKRTHEFVNTLSNISEATGENIRLTNNTSEEMVARRNQLINNYAKKKGVSVEEATAKLKDTVIDAYNTGDGITINVNSPKALNRLVGHELTHSLEDTAEYNTKLQKIAIEYAKTKGEYDSRVEILESLYDGTNADINKELTADIVGDYLFTDQQFINNIHNTDRNLFQRIYDEIKHLIKLVTANTKEAKQLEQLKHSFEKAMRENKSDKTNKVTVQETKSNSSVEVESNTQNKEEYSLSRDVDDMVSQIEMSLDNGENLNDNFIDDLIYASDSYNNGTEFDDIYDALSSALEKEGISRRYDKAKDKYFYDRQELAQKGYDELLNYLDKNNFNYEISRSTEAGYVPSIYIKDADGNVIFRIANHYNDNISDSERVYSDKFSRIFSDKDYANWEERIVPAIENQVVSFDEEYSLSQDNKDRKLSEEQIDFFKDSKVRDENGNLLTVYHGTKADFNTFNNDMSGDNYEGWAYSGKGIYFTDSEVEAKEFGDYSLGEGDTKIKEVYLNITNPFDTSTTDASVLEKLSEGYDVDKGSLERGDFLLRWFRSKGINASEVLQKNGYDGVIDYGHYVVYNSNQIKEVTNKKPTLDDDIRYSLSSVDSEGKELTKEQVEFFKDSKVRDAEGRLLEVYHGTTEEFTTFYPGSFFTDDYMNADGYASGEIVMPVYLNIKNPLIIDAKGMKWDKLDTPYGTSTREIVGNVDTNKYDGIIFENINDNWIDDEDASTGTVYYTFNSNQIKDVDNTNPTESDDIRYSLSVSEANTTKDNKGRTLSKAVIERNKDSKIVDENGNLITVYHTMTDAGTQFNEFNPVGTPGYRFEEQVVNYYTNSKDMSGSYADQDYEMADTTKFNSLDEANKWLNERNDELLEYRVDDSNGEYTLQRRLKNGWATEKTFENLDDLLKNFKKYAHTDVTKFQYEGYVNITNPYVVDAEGRYWDTITEDTNEEAVEKINSLSDEQKKKLKDLYYEGLEKRRQADSGYYRLQEWKREQLTDREQRLLEIFSESKSRPMTDADRQMMSKMLGLEEDIEVLRDEFENKIAHNGQGTLKQQVEEIKYNQIMEVFYTEPSVSQYFADRFAEITGENFTDHIVSSNDLMHLVEVGFDEYTVRDHFSEMMSTNDIVKKVIEMNKNGSNYDGIIIKDVIDYGGDSEFENEANDVYVTFNSNQFKAWDNENPTDDADIRYSLSSTGEMVDNQGNKVTLEASETGSTRSLMAIHNLDEGKLRGVIELGGFPVPSIAIIDSDVYLHDKFGRISVLFDKDTINPSNKLNETYSSDIYSTRFPKIAYEIDKNKWNDFEQWVKENGGRSSSLYSVKNSLENNDIYERSMKANLEVAFETPTPELINEAYNKALETLGNKRIMKPGVEPFTPSGNRKSLKSMSLEYSLDNLVKIMAKKKTKGSEGNAWIGTGEIRANLSKKFKSIEDIRKNKDKLVSSEEMQTLKNQIDSEFEGLTGKLTDYYKYAETNRWQGFENVAYAINETAKKKTISKETLKLQLEEDFIENVPDELLEDTINFLNKLKNVPTEYFEAKPQRAVGLDEVQAVVIPNDTSPEFKQQLQDAGLTYYEYDSSIEGDRQRVINQFDDLKFSLSRTTDDIAPVKDADVFGSDIALQEAIAPLQEKVEELTKVITDLQENIAPASLETAQAEGDRTLQQMTDEDAPVDEGLFTFLDNEIEVKKKQEIINEIASDFNIKKTEARELYNKIDSIAEPTVEDIVKELEAYREVKFQEEDDYVKSIQDYIRGTRLDISEIKKQIPDYGNKYRMSNMGKGLILGNSGQKIDAFYEELHELAPNEFPLSVTAEADQLELISEFMYKDKEITYTDILDDDTLQILAQRIYSDIGNHERYRHTQSGLYFLNKELKNMTPPGEVDNDIPVASNTKQTGEIAPVKRPLKQLNPEATVSEAPVTKEAKITKSKWRNAVDTTQRLFVNEMVETDNLAKETGNLNIKFKGDMLNSVAGEIEGEIQIAQTDNEGHAIGKSLSELFAPAKEKGLYDAFNDYLEHYSNIDRHAQGKGSKTPLNVSQTLVKAYEKSYPEFKQWGKDVWKYGANVRDNLIDAGIISEEHAEVLGTMYPHYVPYMENREMSNYNPDLGEIKPKGVIKRAVGGAENLLPIEDALTKYTFGYKKAVRQNQFYQEIVKTLGPGVEVGADVRNDAIDFDDTLYKDETGNYLTAYVDGERVSTRITDDLYTGLKNDLSKQIKGLEEKYALITEPVQKLSEIRRNLLTSWNPMFIIKNPIMDIQDALFNSKYTKDFMKNYPGAFIELGQAKSETARQFLTLYGSGNVMGEHSTDGTVKQSKFLKGIQRANNVMELAPRYAEFKASLENGASIQEAMYNAREVTTNFSRGGTITKALNKNGFTFLNVSVQGFDKFIRNFSGENGAKGFTGALLKATVLGVVPALFNDLVFGGDDEDEEYEALPDYIKDNYYLIKTGEGEFIRIPKGRMLSVFGSAGRRTLEFMQGEEDAFEGFLKNANSQVGISNPLDSNILTPLLQAYGSENGEAWYGGDLVPSRLQDKAPEEQYDASTDKMSIWLGDKLGISPYKLNYVLDQYSGGIGDIFLPFITEESTSDAEGLGMVLAPIKDQFTANSTFDNKYAGEIYDLSDEMDKMPTAIKETDEYKIQDAYLYSVTSEMGKLYAERRKVQADKNLSKSEKYKKVQAIQDQINSLAKEGMENYKNVSKTDNYAIVGGREFNKYTTDDGTERWGSVFEDTLEDLNSLGMKLEEKTAYFNATKTISSIQDSYKGSDDYAGKKRDVIGAIKGTNLTGEQKAYLYDKYYGNSDVVEAMVTLNVDIDSFLDYEAQDFTADKYANGKTVPNSKKSKVFEYINSMPIEFEQKLILTKLQYPSYNEYNPTIINYLNKSDMTYEQMEKLLTKMDFKVDENGNIRW